jgi:Acetyltransferases, including N-acetylases of ribosomal proteins
MYTGEKIRLREYRKEDIPIRLKYINDPEILRCLESDVPAPVTLNEEEKWFESISPFNGKYRFAIETLKDSQYIGGCSISNVDWKNSTAAVSIFIGKKEFWGNGYGSDTMKTLIKFIFMEMNLNKVRLNVYSFNERAIKCYEKCGFKIEGVLRQEIYREGKYYDVIAMGMLREEYIKKAAGHNV